MQIVREVRKTKKGKGNRKLPVYVVVLVLIVGCPRQENLWWDRIPVSAPSVAVMQPFLDRCKSLCHQQRAQPRLPSKRIVPPRTGPAALPQHSTILEFLSIFQPNIRDSPKPPKVHQYSSHSDTGGLCGAP